MKSCEERDEKEGKEKREAYTDTTENYNQR